MMPADPGPLNANNRFPDTDEPTQLPSPLPQDDDDEDDHIMCADAHTDVNIMVLLLHPLNVSRTLVQLGHEPLPPAPTASWKWLIGREKVKPLAYPWLPRITRHMYHKVGLLRVCSTGLSARVVSELLMTHGETLARRLVCRDAGVHAATDAGDLLETECWSKAMKHGSQMVLWKAYTVLITQPLQVVMVRQMAELLSDKGGGRWIPGLVKDILIDEGLPGLFKGLVPRMLGECATLASYLLLTRLMRQYILSRTVDKDTLMLTRTPCYMLCHRLYYPLLLVGVIVAADGGVSVLPPDLHLTRYTSWTECAKAVFNSGDTLRGYSFLSRRVIHN